jgi:hypothetical protein
VTRALPFTQASLRRAIAAARKEGLRVAGIRPDGTLITVNAGDNPGADLATFAPHNQATPPSKWEDVEV